MEFLYELFCRDPAYFQRLLEFLLHSRFRAVRLALQGGLKKDTVFFSIEGQLINIENNKIRFSTITEWYNSIKGTEHTRIELEQFKEILATNRISIYQILETVRDKEIADFIDLKYRSSILFIYISHRIRAKRLPFSWDKSQTFTVEWKDVVYNVSHTNTTTQQNISVGYILDAITAPEEPITGLYLIQSGKKYLLTEDSMSAPVRMPGLLSAPTPEQILQKNTVEISLAEFQKMQQDIQSLTLLYVSLSQKLNTLMATPSNS